jgi:hypothetical protein
MKVAELIKLLEAQKMPGARVVKFDNSGRLVIDIEQVSKIELNVGDEKEIGYVIAID